jgi:hypothetical protein
MYELVVLARTKSWLVLYWAMTMLQTSIKFCIFIEYILSEVWNQTDPWQGSFGWMKNFRIRHIRECLVTLTIWRTVVYLPRYKPTLLVLKLLFFIASFPNKLHNFNTRICSRTCIYECDKLMYISGM